MTLSSLCLRDRLELLEVLVGVLGELVIVEVLVATVAGELLSARLGLLDHVLHDLLRLGPAALRAGPRRRRVSLDGDGALPLVRRRDRAGRRGQGPNQEPGDEQVRDGTDHGLSSWVRERRGVRWGSTGGPRQRRQS